ncbi:hypothetical protein FEM03_11855 [Phragmitibacter flavus]|uniref:Cytochrome c domain-containing protein n=1 Tax=Phragmitibacter flavus TaxID=2576071 RepID=A0A5R8KDP1_9BACT|nr:hypothetical protein [Phragmitibacter flavus]TLD70420.1 hypothetical protein FEM03_11855 [Phragmitibacter flavus]
MRLLAILALLSFAPVQATERDAHADLDTAPHLYWETHPKDRFTQLADAIEAGRISLTPGDELSVLHQLLDELDIPVSSQLLVFSATSLQSGLINANRPRAIYFNDDTSVGYVPGGRFEILSIDPALGAIFYIFDIPRDGRLPVIDRSTRCMNCHSGERQNFVPSHAVESAIPSITGGTLEAFRRNQFGHGIPFEERFGGWHITGEGSIKKHHGNLVGKLSPKGLQTQYFRPGEHFNWSNYPVQTSDMLAHLLHEHQAGFINLVIEGTYRARHAQHLSNGQLTQEQQSLLDQHAQKIVRYILFADEVPLPPGGIAGDPAYKTAFQKFNRHALPNHHNASLRDLDLRTRLLRFRCSYMIHTELWDQMPAPLKDRVHHHLASALNLTNPHPAYAYLPPTEKQAIRIILTQTKHLTFP